MADPPPYPDANSDTGDDPRVRSDRGSPPSTPRWVKVFGIIVIVLVLLLVILMFTGVGGPHGPGRHIPSGDAGGDNTPRSSVTEGPTPSGGGLGGDTLSDDPDDPTPPIEHGGQQP
jgi:hypothetical protein